MFPDQDLLAHVFRGKWIALGWQYNALKTMRYWHGAFWRDEEVKNLHYICLKPWKRRPELSQGKSTAGGKYTVDAGDFKDIKELDLGVPEEQADAVTHSWWWDEYEEMRDELERDGYGELEYLEKWMAK